MILTLLALVSDFDSVWTMFVDTFLLVLLCSKCHLEQCPCILKQTLYYFLFFLSSAQCKNNVLTSHNKWPAVMSPSGRCLYSILSLFKPVFFFFYILAPMQDLLFVASVCMHGWTDNISCIDLRVMKTYRCDDFQAYLKCLFFRMILWRFLCDGH